MVEYTLYVKGYARMIRIHVHHIPIAMKTTQTKEITMNGNPHDCEPKRELAPLFAANTDFGLSEMDQVEQAILTEAVKLHAGEFYSHALLNLWSAAVHNLRRRVEAFSTDMFLAAVASEPGRKNFKQDEPTLEDRWAGVDDLVLVKGASDLGLLSTKTGKMLETINWMRNHVSAAHYNSNEVSRNDVVAFAMLLNEELFSAGLPSRGYSVSNLFAPVKGREMDQEQIQILTDQIRTLKPDDIRVVFEFLLSLIVNPPSKESLENAKKLFPVAWEMAHEDVRQLAGERYYRLRMNAENSVPDNKEAADRLLYLLVSLSGLKYIPEGARAAIYRKAVGELRVAKDTSYGWKEEEAAARALAQFGTSVPSIAFEEVYQEIFSVWCGNYWGRSLARVFLKPFIDALEESQMVAAAEMFQNNTRVRDELIHIKPNDLAVELLSQFKTRVPLEIQKNKIDASIRSVLALVGKHP